MLRNPVSISQVNYCDDPSIPINDLCCFSTILENCLLII
uniref:Uncharacterized protein n=1 Tax=Planktothrix agardhii TaxID=1160 RepID=A0A1J1JMF3_PLAAG|nr:protein of unknown function [Planktothrix agardhii]